MLGRLIRNTRNTHTVLINMYIRLQAPVETQSITTAAVAALFNLVSMIFHAVREYTQAHAKCLVVILSSAAGDF